MSEFLHNVRLIAARLVFWSRLRLLVTVCAVLAVSAFLSHLASAGPVPVAVTRPPVADAPTATTAPGSTVPAPMHEVIPEPMSDVQTAALAFTRAWTAGGTPSQWVNGMRPYVTPGLDDRFAHGTPDAVPASQATGAPVVNTQTATSATVTVPTDTFPAVLTLARTLAGRWLVSAVVVIRR